MLNGIFVVVIAGSILLAAYTGRMEPLARALLDSARASVELALGLVGVLALFLGLMRVATDAGLLRLLARGLAPVLRKLFPSVPPEHPAMSAIVLNLASNFLGLGNAATPFGIKAMMELDRLNPAKGTATDAMVLFLAINTAGLALIPMTVLGARASLGSQDAAGILLPTWIASGCGTLVAVAASLLLARLPRYRSAEAPEIPAALEEGAVEAERTAEPVAEERGSPPRAGAVVAWLVGLSFLGALALRVVRSGLPPLSLAREIASYWVLPAVVGGIVLLGWARGVRVYESAVEGAKEGFSVALRILPYLVAILVMVGAFRASGGVELLVRLAGPWTERIGLPAEALPMVLLRPLSGSGAYGVMTEILKTHGPDSFLGNLVSTIQGSTETTFYVLAVYFGAVGIRRTRHALPACLLADGAGIAAAILIVNLLYR